MTERTYDYLLSASLSESGLVRGNNEDSFLCMPQEGLFAVADGMGGGEAGEVASALVVDCLKDACSGFGSDSPGTRKYTVQQSLHKANAEIVSCRESHHYVSMGSTAVVFLLDPWSPGHGYVCHVGDSRLYCLRDGELTQVTVDHSAGEDYRKRNPGKPVNLPPNIARALMRVVGGSSYLVPEWQELAVCPGDVWLLCSDGVYGEMSEDELTEALLSSQDLTERLETIRKLVLAHGAHDNFTAVCVEIAAVLPPDAVVEDWEKEESDLLMKVAEARKDYGAN